MDSKEDRKIAAKETGVRVKELRNKRELTQKQLAQYVGVGQQSVAEIESGQTLDPKSMDKIAQVLGVSVAWLKYGKEDDISPRSRYVAERLDTLPESDRKFVETFVDMLADARKSEHELKSLREIRDLTQRATRTREIL